MKKLVLFFSVICASGLTLVSIYNTVIDAQSWASDIPASIQTARDDVSLRGYFAISLLMYAAIVAVTFAYFMPRDLILFTWSIPDHLNEIRTTAAEWSHMNWLRTLLGLIGVLFSFKGLDTYYDCA